jgi:hypothetical protein
MKYLLIILALAIGVSASTGVAYMDQISPPEYNLPWGAAEDVTLRTPTSKVYNLPNGQKQLIARRMTSTNSPMVMGTVTPFDVDATGDDGLTIAVDVAYPPSCLAVDTTATTIGALKNFSVETDFFSANALMQWDTSSIPDGDPVTAATLSYAMTEVDSGIVDDDGRNLDGEWYAAANWPIDCADHADNVGTDAFSEDLTTVVSPIDLGTLTGISKTGFTGLRVGISGGEPSGENSWTIDSSESGNDLLLTVTFGAPDLVLQATGVADGVHELRVEYDGTTVLLYLDDVLEDSTTPVDLVNNANDWEMFTGNSMPYVEFVEFYLDTVLVLWYQFDTLPNLLLEDRSAGTNDIIARYPDTPFGVDTLLLPLTSGDDAIGGSGTVGTTGSTPSSDFTGGGIGPLTGLVPSECATEPAFNNLFDAPKVLIFKMTAFAGISCQVGLIVAAYIVTAGIGIGAYAAFRKTWVMYIAMMIGSMFAIFYGDGIWSWIVPITFAGLCAPFIVKEMRT